MKQPIEFTLDALLGMPLKQLRRKYKVPPRKWRWWAPRTLSDVARNEIWLRPLLRLWAKQKFPANRRFHQWFAGAVGDAVASCEAREEELAINDHARALLRHGWISMVSPSFITKFEHQRRGLQ